MEPGMIDWQVNWTVHVPLLPAHFRVTRLVEHLHQVEMMQGMFALVLVALNCAKYWVVRLVMVEWIVLVVRLVGPSRKEATGGQLNPEQRNLVDRDCAKVQLARWMLIE